MVVVVVVYAPDAQYDVLNEERGGLFAEFGTAGGNDGRRNDGSEVKAGQADAKANR